MQLHHCKKRFVFRFESLTRPIVCLCGVWRFLGGFSLSNPASSHCSEACMFRPIGDLNLRCPEVWVRVCGLSSVYFLSLAVWMIGSTRCLQQHLYKKLIKKIDRWCLINNKPWMTPPGRWFLWQGAAPARCCTPHSRASPSACAQSQNRPNDWKHSHGEAGAGGGKMRRTWFNYGSYMLAKGYCLTMAYFLKPNSYKKWKHWDEPLTLMR